MVLSMVMNNHSRALHGSRGFVGQGTGLSHLSSPERTAESAIKLRPCHSCNHHPVGLLSFLQKPDYHPCRPNHHLYRHRLIVRFCFLCSPSITVVGGWCSLVPCQHEKRALAFGTAAGAGGGRSAARRYSSRMVVGLRPDGVKRQRLWRIWGEQVGTS